MIFRTPKKIITRILPLGLLLVAFGFIFVSTANALETGLQYGTYSGLGTQDLRVTVMNVIRIFLGFLGLIAIILILYAGYTWMTSAGNEEKISRAKKIIVNAVIGLVIILTSFMIVSFIINSLIKATGADGGLGACTADNAGEINGCYICNPPTWQFDSSLPDCDPTTVKECHVMTVTPQGDNRPMNSVVRVRFNYPNITNTDDITVTGPAGPVSGTANIVGNLVEFKPTTNCAAPWADQKCFEANTTYQIQINTGSIQCGGFNLVCGGIGPDPCSASFTTGDFVDTAAPTAQLIVTPICQGPTNQLTALVNDDYGIAFVNFIDATLVLNTTDDNVTVPPPEFAAVNWDTSGYALGNVEVTANVADYDSNTATDSQTFQVQAAHCCNAVQDADETGLDCGGSSCEACVPVIEWVAPDDGAVGNLITIHGRRFGAAAGTVTFLGDPNDPADDVSGALPSTVNNICTDYWSETEIIIVVPPTAINGPIQVTRTDSLSDRTDLAPGTKIADFQVNTIIRPGICAITPLTCANGTNNGVLCNSAADCTGGGTCTGQAAGPVGHAEILQGINFNTTSNQNNVYFAAVLAGGSPVVTSNTKISGISVPSMSNGSVSVRTQDKVSNEFSNPKSFYVGVLGGNQPYSCTTDPSHLTCSPDQNGCDPNQYCNTQCQCEPRQACDNDNFATASCEPNQNLCPPGWYCYNPAVQAPDPSKSSCYCYQSFSCNNPSKPADANIPACHPDTAACPDGYSCDANSNCTCQPSSGITDASTFTWFFSTTSFGPRVVENCNRSSSCQTGTISSPTPFSREGVTTAGYRVSLGRPDDGAVPIDSFPAAMFTQKMYKPSLNNTTVKLYKCNPADGNFNAADCANEVANSLVIHDCNYLDQDDADATCVDLNPSGLLEQNRWYQIVLATNSIFGSNGVKLAGNSADGWYRWVFKTRNSADPGKVACVYVQPAYQTSIAYAQPKDWYSYVSPQDFVCVNMDPNVCSWNWKTNEPAANPRAEIINQNLNHATSSSLIETLPNPPVQIVAQCSVTGIFKEGQGLLKIDFSSPYVIERFPDCGAACLNASIGAKFSRPMNDTSVINALDLYVCYDDANCAPSVNNIVTTFNKPAGVDPLETNTYIGNVDCFDANGDGNYDYCLLPNTYYRVVINGTAISQDTNKFLVGLNYDNPLLNGVDPSHHNDSYSWVFKTQTNFGLCLPSSINVVPADKLAPVNAKVKYGARPRGAVDSCDPNFGQRLNPYSWSWDWDSNLTSKNNPVFNFGNPFCSGGDLADFLTTSLDGYCPIPHPGQLRDGCGNGVVELGEDCDDGNIISGDGCSGTETAQSCLNEGTVAPTCGNDVIDQGEDCDPSGGNGCDTNCLWQGITNNNASEGVCGNGLVEKTEECDTPGQNGCTNSCLLTGSVVNQSLCGDGQIGVGEECDGGELASGGTPSDADGNNCSAKCLIQNRAATGICRSNSNNTFNFNLGACVGSCPTGYSCVELSVASGNNNTGPICGDAIIEKGEECDLGGICSDSPNKYCTISNLSACADPLTATCQTQTANGCSDKCLHTGSVPETVDPPNVGPYQIAQTFADGQIYVQSWVANYTPAQGGPLGQGFLFIGNGGLDGPVVIDRWPDCGTACINAEIGAQFSVSMDTTTFNGSNIFLYQCANAACDLAQATLIAPILISPYWTTNQNDTFFIQLPPTYNEIDYNHDGTIDGPVLLPNTDYRVVIRNDVTNAAGDKKLVGLNFDDPGFNGLNGYDAYTWTFKTQPNYDLCQIGKVQVHPNDLTTTANQRILYFSQPWSNPDQCDPINGQRLDPYFYSWSWDVNDFDGFNAADLEIPLRDGCGNGILEFGESCDDGNLTAGDGCNSQCLLEADVPSGNSNTFAVCGDGVIQATEACDNGTEPNGDDSDGCTDICTLSGALPNSNALCGDGIIEAGEECDTGELAQGKTPQGGDAGNCTGYYLDNTSSPQADCQQVNFSTPAQNHLAWCSWTGNGCQTRPCLLEDKNTNVCRSDATNKFDFNQNPDHCQTGFHAFNYLLVTGNNNYNQPVCGNAKVESGEECDWGGYICSGTNNSCDPADSNACGDTPSDCISINHLFGCSDICLNTGSWRADGRIDPYQWVRTFDVAGSGQDEIKELVKAWDSFTPNVVGVGDLKVKAGSNIPFAVIGHQPPVGADNQCRNVAIFALFSKELNLSSIYGDGKNDNMYVSTSDGNTFNLAPPPSGLPDGFVPSVGFVYPGSGGHVALWSGATFYESAAGSSDNFTQVSAAALVGHGLPPGFKPLLGFYSPLDGGKIWLSDGFNLYISSNGAPYSRIDSDGLVALGLPPTIHFSQGYYTALNGGRINLWAGSTLYESAANTGSDFTKVNLASRGLPAGYSPTVAFSHQFNGGFIALWQKDTIYTSNDGVSYHNNYLANMNLPAGFMATVGYNDTIAGSPGSVVLWGDGNADNIKLCLGDCTTNPTNLIKSYSYKPVRGKCVGLTETTSGLCSYEQDDVTGFGICRSDSDCAGSKVEVTGIRSDTGFLAANQIYQLFVRPGASGVLSAFDDTLNNNVCDGVPAASCPPTNSLATAWNFKTNSEFCKCDYVGITIDPTSGDTETRKDIFTCADDQSCGSETETPLDNDIAPGITGNQHLYEATCYDINNLTGSRIQLAPTGLWFNWLAISPDKLIYLTPIVAPPLNNKIYVTPYNKNGESQVKSSAKQYFCAGTDQMCDQYNPVACPGSCLASQAAIQLIKVTNFICRDPWPGVINGTLEPYYEDVDTNFRLFYCRDFGTKDFADDLPALAYPPTTLQPTGSVIKDLLFPVNGAQAGDVLGIRVLPNVLHLSPATWFQSGLCSGLPKIENVCYSDADCTATNIFTNGGFENLGAHWKTEVASPSASISVNYSAAAARSGSHGAFLTINSFTGWGAQLVNDEDIMLTPGVYTVSAFVKSSKPIKFGAQKRGEPWTVLCENANCNIDPTSKRGLVCSSQQKDWEKLTCVFTLSSTSNIQFIVRGTASGQTYSVDDVNLAARSCQFNVPTHSSVQQSTIDGYQAINGGRTAYVGATNQVVSNLYSNVYLLSYSQAANDQSKEIYNRLLDSTGQTGVWYFNANVDNSRTCNVYGYYDNTSTICQTSPDFGFGEAHSSECALNNDQASCAASATSLGCYWNNDLKGCLAKLCYPIYCQSNFDCPNSSCNAGKQQLIRDAKRYADLDDIQLNLIKFGKKNNSFPALGGGTYIANTSFSEWPSWQQTLGTAVGSSLPTDPLNRFVGCSNYYCDTDASGKIDPGEAASGNACNYGDVTACSSQPKLCLPLDPDQEKTCWDEIGKQFFCPAPMQMFTYAYLAGNNGSSYKLFTNFEFNNSATWQSGSYQLPLSAVVNDLTCEKLNFEVHSATIAGGLIKIDCSTKGGDADNDGVCDGVGAGVVPGFDNCPARVCSDSAKCYNPNQRNTNGNINNLGDVCDVTCTGDADNDGVCDNVDNCKNVYNSTPQKDSDNDGIGDACDPCTDLDKDGAWDVDTGVNDPKICHADNCSVKNVGFCLDLASKKTGERCGVDPATGFGMHSDCTINGGVFCQVPFVGSGNPGVSGDRNKYCLSAAGVPTPKICQTIDNCSAGQICDRPSGEQYRYYNPYQEDYDNDLVGYICDSCLDFDGDNFGDYSFYTKSSDSLSAATLTNDQKDHLAGCQLPFVAFTPFSGPPPSDSLITDLDNCPAGPNGAACKDQFGIAISCANPAVPAWRDVYDYNHTHLTQPDFNLNNKGDVCDAFKSVCGDGLVDSAKGEVCDCGSSVVSTDTVHNPLTCTSLNNVPCTAPYGPANTCHYCSSCSVVKEATGGYCGDGIVQWQAPPLGNNEKCDDGANGLCLDDCSGVNLAVLGSSCTQQTTALTFGGAATYFFGADGSVNINGPTCSLATGLKTDLAMSGTIPITDIVFISDVSGSMTRCLDSEDNCSSPNRRIDALRQALHNTINELVASGAKDTIRVGLITFETNTHNNVVDKGGCAVGGGSLCSLSNQGNIDFLNGVIDDNSIYTPAGGTRPNLGVGMATQITTGTGHKVIYVLMSDGGAEAGSNICTNDLFNPYPASCYIRQITCDAYWNSIIDNNSCPCGLLGAPNWSVDQVNWDCSALDNATAVKPGVQIYAAAFVNGTGNYGLNDVSSNSTLAKTCNDPAGYCFSGIDFTNMYTAITTNIINSLGYSYSLSVDAGGSLPINLPYQAGNPNYLNQTLPLPANYCNSSTGQHLLAVSGLQAGWNVTFSNMKLTYCPSCDVDGDGLYSAQCGGVDCNDNNPLIGACTALSNTNIQYATKISQDNVIKYLNGGIVASAFTDSFCNDPSQIEVGSYYLDSDGDGQLSSTAAGICGTVGDPLFGCPVGSQKTVGQDCNDSDPNIKTGAPEICSDGVDNNCNGQIDEGCSAPSSEICANGVDDDGDGYADCADFDCLGQADGSGKICCGDSSKTPPINDNVCGACNYCQTIYTEDQAYGNGSANFIARCEVQPNASTGNKCGDPNSCVSGACCGDTNDDLICDAGVDATLPNISIQTPTANPTYTAPSSPINLSGTASDNISVSNVTWNNSTGGSGTAVGTNNWTVTGVNLQAGSNLITVTAVDPSSNAKSATLSVAFTPPDATPPTVAIVSPTINPTITVTTQPINLAGTASDNIGVTAVIWANSTGGSGSASYTAPNWTAATIPLHAGSNILTITAQDAAANSAQATLTVTYNPPSGSYYCDMDSDTYISVAPTGNCTPFPTCIPTTNSCGQTVGNDCNDTAGTGATINPGATDNNCDLKDNNCNGQVDEGYSPVPSACGVGACAATGQLICTTAGIQNTCTPGSPTTEICDGVDNNCNGTVDEGCAGQCTSGQTTTCADSQFNGNTWYHGACISPSLTVTCNAANGSWNTSACTGASTPEATLCTDNIDNDCDGLADCQDTIDCPAGNACSGNCLASATCNTTTHAWVCAPQPSSFCGAGGNACGTCVDTNPSSTVANYQCQANSSVCTGGANYCGTCTQNTPTNFTCNPDQTKCDTAQCQTCSAGLSCDTVTNAQDCDGTHQCCTSGFACDNGGSCVSVPDADHDGIADNQDVCPYDSANDDDSDGLCAVGCSSGSSRFGSKTNGWVCLNTSPVVYDPCLGSANNTDGNSNGVPDGCESVSACRIQFGAKDYLNIYVNGKMLTGNYNLPQYTMAANPSGKFIGNGTKLYFVVDSYLTFGGISNPLPNVISFEALDSSWSDREIRGAFTKILEDGNTNLGAQLCSDLGTEPALKSTDSYVHNSSLAMPVKCLYFDDSTNQPPVDWKTVGFNPAAWPNSINGNSGSDFTLANVVYVPKYGNAWPVWGGPTPLPPGYSYSSTSRVYCRYDFLR
ncbi:MAG: MopE-related protein [Patescibacteria group bacterium]|nr:MopE-related protein [Patescibacteria group bacterium]